MTRKILQPGVHSDLPLVFRAPMSKSMAEMLLAAFDGRAEAEHLVLESREFGLWIVDENTGVRMFIGSTTKESKHAEH
ncbi:hypothetical protein [Paracoccus aminophilus]|uniref:hypothetical protein n=1 Tax=Paracoccus aminophilus TaxID=34003 RepID=UPI00059F5BE1|nr:hypothetical protein [Paracoccus aminophilus]